MSTRREKFVKLAEGRINKTITNIRNIGNLSNKSNYEYTEQDVSKMFRKLREELSDSEKRFRRKSESRKDKFKL